MRLAWTGAGSPGGGGHGQDGGTERKGGQPPGKTPDPGEQAEAQGPPHQKATS